MGSALDARGIKSAPDNLVAHVEGIIENVDGVALITRIRDRKYRQQGYRSQPAGERRPEPPPADAPRSGGMLAKRTVSRCGACGAVLPIATAALEQCPNCRAAIRACRQCTHFDTSRRFE